MRILLLGYNDTEFIRFLENDYNSVTNVIEPINLEYCKQFDFIISYGYRHIITKDIIDYFGKKIINLHISYLPFNRGADPNFWSFIDNTKKGVTIHLIDSKLDTGDILCQKTVKLSENQTLRETYSILQTEIKELFYKEWHRIKKGTIKAKKQGKGTYHNSIDKNKYIQGIEYLDIEIHKLKAKINDKDSIIDIIQEIRTKNNKNWMQLLRIAFKYAPKEASKIMKDITKCDLEINKLTYKL